MRGLIEAAREFYVEKDSAVAEVEQIIAMDEDEIETYSSDNVVEAETTKG